MKKQEFTIECLGHKYKCRLDEYHNMYIITSDTGFVFRISKEKFDNEYLDP